MSETRTSASQAARCKSVTMSGSKYCVAAVVALINDCFVGPKNSRWKSSRQKELRNDHEKVISLLRLAGVDVSRRVPPPFYREFVKWVLNLARTVGFSKKRPSGKWAALRSRVRELQEWSSENLREKYFNRGRGGHRIGPGVRCTGFGCAPLIIQPEQKPSQQRPHKVISS